ncbi:MAG: phytanoyl-CoA dioxygenase family protein [Chthonomonadaceae bacterium]|nr:phytanoyl-CoA dioxygenase family protein [Chthonomonadaceae bacterium]
MPVRKMTDEQRLFFEANGYLVIPNALSPEELETVREVADRAEAVWRADPTRPGLRKPNQDQIQAPIEYDQVLLDLLAHPKVFPIAWELLGDDISMIDNDYFITPPHSKSHALWHHDSGQVGIYHPRSTLMVKAFYLLSDVPEGGGGTAVIPGSHRFQNDFVLPQVENPDEMPGLVGLAYPAGTAYLFTGRIYHAALNNLTDFPRRALIYNYGHHWMKVWDGYAPSEQTLSKAKTRVMRQLLGAGDAYGTSLAGCTDLEEPG